MTVVPRTYSGSGKKEKVRSMFNSIAPKYDLLNRVLSAGIDKRWRRKVIQVLKSVNHDSILDLATGTADLAIEAATLNAKKITGIDISERMLEVGRKKVAQRNLTGIIELICADSTSLPFSDNVYDAITVGFGIRNFEDLQKGFKEMHRVLVPGGWVVVLEFSQPQQFPVKQLYSLYSRKIMPFIGQLLSRQKAAYQYLPESVKAFPYGKKLLEIMESEGFTDTKWLPLTFGIASIYCGRKKP